MKSNAGASTVNVAVVQAGSVPFDMDACVDKAIRLIEEAAATGVARANDEAIVEAFGYPVMNASGKTITFAPNQ